MKKWTQKRLLRARFRLCLLGPALHLQQGVVPSVLALKTMHPSGLLVHCRECKSTRCRRNVPDKLPSPPGDGWAQVDQPEGGAAGGPAIAAAGEQVPVPRPVGWRGLRVRPHGRVFVVSHDHTAARAVGPTVLPRAGHRKGPVLDRWRELHLAPRMPVDSPSRRGLPKEPVVRSRWANAAGGTR